MDEQRLVRRLQQGDRRAFEEFLDAYGGRVHRLVRRYVSNESDAEDITQEVFLDLYRGVKNFRGDAALSTWIYRVTVNHCFKHRQRAKPPGVPLDEALSREEDWRADPLRAAGKSELRDQVNSAIGTLSPLHRDVVILHELHGLTYQECASILDVPVGTVKSRLSNAFRRLRESLGGYVLGQQAGTAPQLSVEAAGEMTS
jgi:RNA polymerase sigma-70 factor (ECF subfamily)